jgi:insulysin
MPVSYAMKDQRLLVSKGGHSNEEILEGLKTITVDDVLPVVNDLKKKDFQLTTLVMGNIAEDEVQKLQADFEKSVPVSMNVAMEDVETVSPVIKPGRRVEVRKTNPRKGDPNHVTTVSIQYGVPDISDSVKFGILSQVLRPAAYDELRTNQQLGYVVQGGIGMDSNVLHASVMVQGDAKLPDEIEPQIEMVLTTIMEKKLAEMTDQEFEAFKASYAKQLLEPPLGFSEEIGHFWPVIARGNTCSDKALLLLKYLREELTSKDQLIEAWHKITNSQEPRSKVVVKFFSDTLGAVPTAPTIDEYTEALRALKVPESAIELAQKEAETAIVFSKVDSTSRAELLKYEKASFYPQEIKCGAKTTALKSAFMRKKNKPQAALETEE